MRLCAVCSGDFLRDLLAGQRPRHEVRVRHVPPALQQLRAAHPQSAPIALERAPRPGQCHRPCKLQMEHVLGDSSGHGCGAARELIRQAGRQTSFISVYQ